MGPPPLANGALCLSTPKHNGKSGTGYAVLVALLASVVLLYWQYITNTRGFARGFVNYKKGALDSQLQVIKFTSCLPMVGGSLRVLPASSTTKTGRHDIAEILLKVALKHQNSIKSNLLAVYIVKQISVKLTITNIQ